MNCGYAEAGPEKSGGESLPAEKRQGKSGKTLDSEIDSCYITYRTNKSSGRTPEVLLRIE